MMKYRFKDWHGGIVLGVVYILIITCVSQFLVSDARLDIGSSPPPLARWDSNWYVAIARDGFMGTSLQTPTTAAFLPLYPIITRIFSEVTFTSLYTAGIWVSRLSFLLSLCLLFIYSRNLKETKVNPQAVIIAFLAFPTAFVTISMYSEGLFLALCLASFYFINKGKPYASFVAAFAAALTRINGLALAPAFLVMAWMNWRNRKPYVHILLPALAPLLSFLSQMYYFYFRFDQPLLYFIKKNAFGDNIGVHWPWVSIQTSITKLMAAQPHGGLGLVYYYLEIPLLLFIFVCAVILWKKKLWAEAAFICASAGLTFISGTLWGLPRFTIFLFPIFFILSTLHRQAWLWYSYLFTAIFIQALVLINYVMHGRPPI